MYTACGKASQPWRLMTVCECARSTLSIVLALPALAPGLTVKLDRLHVGRHAFELDGEIGMVQDQAQRRAGLGALNPHPEHDRTFGHALAAVVAFLDEPPQEISVEACELHPP